MCRPASWLDVTPCLQQLPPPFHPPSPHPQFMGICVTEQRGMLLQEYCAGKDLEAGRWRAALPAGELPLAPVVWCAGGTYLRVGLA